MPDGSVLMVGALDGTSDFGAGDALPPLPPLYHPYLVKLKADGTFAWARDAGEGFDGMIAGKMTDVLVAPGSNDIITTGHVGYDASAVMVWRWDAEGNPVPGWGKSLFAQYEYYYHTGSRLALSPDGTVLYVSGIVRYDGTFACASPLSFDTGGAKYPFVAAIAMSTGDCVWARIYEGDNRDTRDIPIAVTPIGGITLASVYRGSAPQGSMLPDASQPGEAVDRAYLMRLNPTNGDIIQAVAFPPPMVGSFMGDVRVNPVIKRMISIGDDVYIAGNFYGTISMPDQPLYPFSLSTELGDDGNAVVMELDPKVLGVRWGEAIRGTASPDATSLAVLGDDLIIAGTTAGPVHADPKSNEAALCTGDSSQCLFLLRMGRADRTRRWFREWVAQWDPQPGNVHVAIGPDGLALAAELVPPIDLGTGLLGAKGSTDIVVAKVPPLP